MAFIRNAICLTNREYPMISPQSMNEQIAGMLIPAQIERHSVTIGGMGINEWIAKVNIPNQFAETIRLYPRMTSPRIKPIPPIGSHLQPAAFSRIIDNLRSKVSAVSALGRIIPILFIISYLIRLYVH
jgi:hypothetical protein